MAVESWCCSIRKTTKHYIRRRCLLAASLIRELTRNPDVRNVGIEHLDTWSMSELLWFELPDLQQYLALARAVLQKNSLTVILGDFCPKFPMSIQVPGNQHTCIFCGLVLLNVLTILHACGCQFTSQILYLLPFFITSQEATSKFANLDSNEKENHKKSQKRLQLQKNKVCLGVFLPFLNW